MRDDEGFLVSFCIRFGPDAQVCLFMSLLLQWPFTFKTLGENHGNQRDYSWKETRTCNLTTTKYVLLLACVPG